jgi:hypothetical protein
MMISLNYYGLHRYTAPIRVGAMHRGYIWRTMIKDANTLWAKVADSGEEARHVATLPQMWQEDITHEQNTEKQ